MGLSRKAFKTKRDSPHIGLVAPVRENQYGPRLGKPETFFPAPPTQI